MLAKVLSKLAMVRFFLNRGSWIYLLDASSRLLSNRFLSRSLYLFENLRCNERL